MLDKAKIKEFKKAYKSARLSGDAATAAEAGETVMVIAAVIAGSALVYEDDPKWPKRLAGALGRVKGLADLDDAGRRKALQDQPKAKIPPLELAAKVLPFNFR